MNVFVFDRQAALKLVSVSVDGVNLPKLFTLSDMQLSITSTNFTPSAIVSVDGRDVNSFLAAQDATIPGHDPDANYNQMLFNQASHSIMQTEASASYWPGYFFANNGLFLGNSTNIVFENGTSKSFDIVAYTSADFSNVQNGNQFFNEFCTGNTTVGNATSASTTASASANPSTATATPIGYPSPIAIMSDLAVGGYFLDEGDLNNVAVLSIPSFDPLPSTPSLLAEFSDTVTSVIRNATSAGKDKLIIDLRGNAGGTTELAYDTFRQLFPTIEPYGGFRLRSIEALNQIGQAASQIFANTTLPETLSPELQGVWGEVFNYKEDYNASNQPFDSWSSVFGPNEIYGDNFTALIRRNNSSPYIDAQGQLTIYGYGSRSNVNLTQPFEAKNIVLLQDGLCASTCAIFTEFMKTQGNVQSIVLGGRPQNGPMQGIGRTKGAEYSSWSVIHGYAVAVFGFANVEQRKALANTPLGALYNATQFAVRTLSANTGVNARNNYRQGDTTQTPLQFVYEAADCRLWYTPAMIFNVTATWAAVARAQWGVNGTSMCVQNSTKGEGSLSSGNITVPGTPIISLADAGGNLNSTTGLPDTSSSSSGNYTGPSFTSSGNGPAVQSTSGAGRLMRMGLAPAVGFGLITSVVMASL